MTEGRVLLPYKVQGPREVCYVYLLVRTTRIGSKFFPFISSNMPSRYFRQRQIMFSFGLKSRTFHFNASAISVILYVLSRSILERVEYSKSKATYDSYQTTYNLGHGESLASCEEIESNKDNHSL
jgi:hypothetical protein